jgi:hypothetical protein
MNERDQIMATSGARHWLALLATLVPATCLAQTYFPPGVLGETPEAAREVTNQYSRVLKVLHEPSFLELAQQEPTWEAYRFLWLREFDHPVSIRLIIKSKPSGWFYRRMASGKSPEQPGRIRDSGMSWSWRSRTASFLRTVEVASFWELPTLTQTDQPCRSHWVIEGIRHGQYHVIDRCSPDLNDPVREIGVRAIAFGHLRNQRRSVY